MKKKKSTTKSDSKPLSQNIESDSGQIIQAGGDVTIFAPQPAKAEKTGAAQKIKLWLGIAVMVVTIVSAFLGWIKGCDITKPASAAFYGVVKNQHGKGIAGAAIVVLTKVGGDTIGSGNTDSRGGFNLTVTSKPEETVYVIVQKNGRAGFKGFKTLAGNAKLTFTEK